MNTLITVYLFFFVVWSLIGLRESKLSDKSLVVLLTEGLASIAGIVIILAFLFDLRSYSISLFWFIILIVAVAGEILSIVTDIQSTSDDPELASKSHISLWIFGISVSVILYVPVIILGSKLTFAW